MAKSAVCHSGRLEAKRPMRSPGLTPSSKKACERPAMRRRNSSEEISCHREAVRNIWARGFGQVSMAWRRLEGRVPELMVCGSLYRRQIAGAIGAAGRFAATPRGSEAEKRARLAKGVQPRLFLARGRNRLKHQREVPWLRSAAHQNSARQEDAALLRPGCQKKQNVKADPPSAGRTRDEGAARFVLRGVDRGHV